MRSSFILFAGICLMQPALAQAQDPKPQPPAQGATKPQEPPTERKEVKVAEKVSQDLRRRVPNGARTAF